MYHVVNTKSKTEIFLKNNSWGGCKEKTCIQILRTLVNMKRMEWIFVVKRKRIQQSVHCGNSLKTEGKIMTFSRKQKLWICVVSGDTARNIQTSSSEGKEKIQAGNSDPEKERVPRGNK